MAELKGGGKKRRRKGQKLSVEEQEAQEEQEREEEERERTTVRVNEFLTISELAELMDVSSTDIIGSAFKNLQLLVTINHASTSTRLSSFWTSLASLLSEKKSI